MAPRVLMSLAVRMAPATPKRPQFRAVQALVRAPSTVKGEEEQQAASFGRKYSYFNGYDVMNY